MESTTITTDLSPTTTDRRAVAAFSLVEVMVALTLITIVLAALFSSWSFVGRSTLAMTHYTELNSAGRMGLEIFAQDVRRARWIEDDFEETDFTLIMEEPDGSERKIRYIYNQQNRSVIRHDNVSDASDRIFPDVENVAFAFYDTTGALADNSLEARLIQLELLMARDVRGRDATKKIVSARYIMRNKDHGQ